MHKCVEVFCGAGGLALGLTQAGFSHSGMYDLNELAIFTANTNHKNLATCLDIRECLEELIEAHRTSDLDLLTGGPPCQPFSVGGSGKASDDERNLLPEMIRLVKELKPKTFLIENVSGLFKGSLTTPCYGEYVKLELKYCDAKLVKSKDRSSWLSRYRELLAFDHRAKPGDGAYNVQVWGLNAADFGVPQIRRRTFLVGVRRDLDVVLAPPIPTHSRDALAADQFSGLYWKRHRIKMPVELRAAIDQSEQQKHLPGVAHAKPWVTVRDAFNGLCEPYTVSSAARPSHMFIPGARMYEGHTGSVYDQPSKTITAGTHGVGGGQNTLRLKPDAVRYFSLYECQLLQTFPEDYEFVGSRSAILSQIGNAVPPLLARVVGEKLASCLK